MSHKEPTPPFDYLFIDQFVVQLWEDNHVAITSLETMTGIWTKIGNLMMLCSGAHRTVEKLKDVDVPDDEPIGVFPHPGLHSVLWKNRVAMFQVEQETIPAMTRGVKMTIDQLGDIFDKANKRLQEHRAEKAKDAG